MRRYRRFLSVVAALAVTVAALGGVSPVWRQTAGAVTQADIDALQGSVQDIAREIEDLEDRLAQIQGDKEQALAEKENLDSQITLLNSQIEQQDRVLAQYDALIEEYDGLIAEKQAQVEELQAEEEAQYQRFCRRVRAMEEQGSVSYLSILFSAANFTELLDNVILIGEIMDYDTAVVHQLEAARTGVERAQAELVEQQEEQRAARSAQQLLRDEQEASREQLRSRQAQAEELVARIQSQESEYQTALAQMEEEEERIQGEIVRMSRELAAQQEQTSVALGGYIWPVSSRRITSPFGSRNTGIPGASTNHKGVDIGGVGYTTQIHAAKAGTVIISRNSRSYGNYVVVSHGDGNTTLYAHMSSRKVSEGDVVAQGDVLGITGSTGISRGAHLHFEITEGGVRVDPLNYLTGYVQAW